MISILIPVFNEEGILETSIDYLVDFLTERDIAAEILLVDNGSTDNTRNIALRLSGRFPNVRYLRQEARGPGRAFRLGVEEAKGDYLITLDADLSGSLEFIPNALSLLEDADAVVGAKTFGKQRRTLTRVVGSHIFILCTQFLFDIPVADFSMGSKVFRRSDIMPIASRLDGWTGYILEIIIHLNLKKKKIVQISVDCNDTRRSKFNLLHEAVYRFSHLRRVRKLVKDERSWLHG